MKINHNKFNPLINTQSLEQAARLAAQAKAAEAAKARAADETLQLQKQAEQQGQKVEKIGEQSADNQSGRRPRGYRPDGSLEEDPDDRRDAPGTSHPGIDLKA